MPLDSKELTFREKRYSKRHSCWAMVSISELGDSEVSTTSGYSSDFFGSCVNLSEDGMLLESFEKYSSGTLLKLEFNIPREDDNLQYKIIGCVIHSTKLKKSNSQGLGIKFTRKIKNISKILS